MELPLANGRGVALIDAEDFPLVQAYRWRLKKDGWTNYAYAPLSIKGDPESVNLSLHHAIMGKPPKGWMIDHVNGDGLDNRRCNLRLATADQNCANTVKRAPATSPFKGVYWVKKDRKWCARIYRHGKRIQLGYFACQIAAAAAYDQAASQIHGEFARPNLTIEALAALRQGRGE